jgi:hypothetical protein
VGCLNKSIKRNILHKLEENNEKVGSNIVEEGERILLLMLSKKRRGEGLRGRMRARYGVLMVIISQTRYRQD